MDRNIMFAEQKDCTKSLEMVKNFAKQFIKLDEHSARTRIDDVEGAYRKHLQDIQANHSFNGDIAPEYEIAIRLMYNGYTKDEVCLAVYKCAPSHCTLPHWKKSWGEYAQHVASYAFSEAAKWLYPAIWKILRIGVKWKAESRMTIYPKNNEKKNQRTRHSQWDEMLMLVSIPHLPKVHIER